uniref:NodB homology domain-containing protein n=1 Tax=Phakopsora pachyrhizi TaxID=170000 RepID=A0A0S1MJ25_PHAPC
MMKFLNIVLFSPLFLMLSSNSSPLLSSRQSIPIYNQCRVENSFSLTIDDGFSALSKSLTQVFDDNQVRATFFINGNNAACIYYNADDLKARHRSGHLLANHGWSHAHMTQLSRANMVREVERVEQAFIKILGLKPLYFRPPYGEYNDVLLSVLSERGYKGLIMWNQDSGDSSSPPTPAEDILAAYDKYPAKSIVLNHEITQKSVQTVLPTVIPILKRKFSLQTSAECLGLGSKTSDYYQYVSEPGTPDSTWVC